MNTLEVIGVVKDLVPILAIIIGAFVGTMVYFQYAPVLNLRIIPNWVNDNKSLLLVRFEVENKSKVRFHSPEGRIQMLEYPVQMGGTWPQWIPFKKDVEPPSGEAAPSPIQWREPIKIFSTTNYIYPGETIVLERLYHIPQESIILHFGLQVKMKLGWLGQILTRKGENWSQTTTCFAVKYSGQLSTETPATPDRASFEAAMAKVADTEPEEHDRL